MELSVMARGWIGVSGRLVNPALEGAKQKTLQSNATSFCIKMKSRREEGSRKRAGFRARDMTKPTPQGLSISLPLLP